jgi:hypothetical protein
VASLLMFTLSRVTLRMRYFATIGAHKSRSPAFLPQEP